VNAEVDYHASAVLDDQLELAVRIARFGRSSFTLHVAIFRGDERLTDMALTYAHVDINRDHSVPLPGSFIAEVRSFQPDPPAMPVAR
jgi:acyl-CoA thioester hydrolase